MKLLISLVFWVYLQIAIFIASILSFVIPSIKGFYFLVRWLLRIQFALCFLRVEVEGVENLPRDERLIFIANKPNLISTFALITYFPLYFRFVAGQEMFKIFFLGRVIKCLGCIPAVKKKQETFKFAATVLSAIRKNESVMFYPLNLRKGERL